MSTASTGTRPGLLSRTADTVEAAALWAVRVRVWMPGPVRWVLAEPRRVLVVAWLVGLLLVAYARSAVAEPIIVGPDLAHGGAKTLFESYDFLTYKLTVKPDDESSGWFSVGAAVLQVIGFVNNLILWVCLGLLYGGLTLLQWFLNLTIYRDSAGQIDTATQLIAGTVFWPLLAATVAVGAFLAYARWRGEGRGFVSDLGWVVAAGAIAVGFAAGPSQLMNEVDSVRQDMAAGIIAGSGQYASVAGNPTGFPTPQIGGNQSEASTRKLVDSVWSTFGATTWCFAQFHEVDICRVAGHHALADDDTWHGWMEKLDDQKVPAEFGIYGNWVRGQDMTRTGYLLFLALITVPMALMLLRLVISGLVAVVGLLLMLVIGLLFLAAWPIPGWFRQLGTRYWVYTLGLELQALFITVVIAGIMVVSTLISTQAGHYGFFIVAVLNLALFVAAVKARGWLDMLTTVGGGSSMGVGTALILRSIARSAVTAGAGLATGGAATAAKLAGGAATLANSAGRGPGWGSQPGAKTTALGTRGGSKPHGSPRMSPLARGPITATATRAPMPGSHPALSGRSPAALPAGSPRPAGAPGTSTPGTSAARTAPGGHRPGTRTARSAQPGSGLSRLEKTPPPTPAAARRGVYRITTVPPRGAGKG